MNNIFPFSERKKKIEIGLKRIRKYIFQQVGSVLKL